VSAASLREPPVVLDDIAVYFSKGEWEELAEWRKELYRNVMKDNYAALYSLGKLTPSRLLGDRDELGLWFSPCWLGLSPASSIRVVCDPKPNSLLT
uniref:KRAB domain-containing protein n=1 Tax=Apteryx owenii TaxID=8824 RepID=A0A8B9NWK7_APTOW